MDLEERVRSFCKEVGIRSFIAISGGASSEDGAEFIDTFMGALKNSPVGVVTSGTKNGIPLLTVQAAKRHAVPIVRVYPSRASDHDHLAPDAGVALDLSISPRLAESAWGDESEVFVKLASGLVFLGGGAGTLIEFAHWAKNNKTRSDQGRGLIPAVIVGGTRGFDDWTALQETLHIPINVLHAADIYDITRGSAAAEWLLHQIGFEGQP